MDYIMEEKFLAYLNEIYLLKQAVALLEYDSQTGMPESASDQRSEVISYLSGQIFHKEIHEQMPEFVAYFKENPEQLTEFGEKVFEKVLKNYDLNHKIPEDRYQLFVQTTAEAHHAWLKAREAKDFNFFAPYLSKIIELLQEFIPLWHTDQKTPYDVLLDQYEPGLTTEELDRVFGTLKEGILDIKAVLDKKESIDTSFLNRYVPKELQKKYVTYLVDELGYDFSRGKLDDTVHPFMLAINRNDARITTRWDEHDVSMALFGVIHEAGHGIYEQNIDPQYDKTPLSTGVSMGIHESQSLFYEILVGGNYAFWQYQYPKFQEMMDGIFDDIDLETFYQGINQVKASLIRIESDKLTYPLHIIIRYEIEKMIFNESIDIQEIPKIWADKYEEYLGIRPQNDLEGVLQDVHWSGGSFGYFPSYALGYMYAAQLYAAMNQEFSVPDALRTGNYDLIKQWLTEHIHQYGASKQPNELLLLATGQSLDPNYLIDYLKDLYLN